MKIPTQNLLQLAIVIFLLSCGRTEKQGTETQQDTWYKNAFIYNVEVGTFKDSDGDGLGDFKGLIQKLPYLDSLGVDVIWLSPFMPSPGKDDGYDITDYYRVNPKLGTMADFDRFLAEAKSRKIRVITDIVLNHTSVEHPWFRKARADSNSKYRLWYVWADKKPADADKGMVFPGVQKETWSYDSVAKKYYFHRFYKFQPDLNYGNPDVQREAFNILKFWLKKGVDGYRLDAVPFIIDLPETGSENPERMLNLVARFRKEMKAVKPDALMLGEANLAPEENKDYFGDNGEGMQMMFNFYANQYLFYALASGNISELVKALRDTKQKPPAAQWAYFLRNHDEVDLARLSTKQRNLIFAKFGPDSNMQLYERGIRRRLAPMLNNARQLRMAYSLLFSLPGAPVIRYGEEIGMGDDLSLQERLSVRTPMQWSLQVNGGFSSSRTTVRPVISFGSYGYQRLNVAEQQRSPGSLLNFITHLSALRKQHPEIGLANFEVLDSKTDHILAIDYRYQKKRLMIIHNFSKEPLAFHLDPAWSVAGTLNELLSGRKLKIGRPDNVKIELEGYACRWYEILP
ncbi:alpha-amylase family protein [Arcticibacter sp. MXS-1]|uniref:alpha-amylase family protein n=1 Tax=Arcticibacter sp. MXS-1 TaxID=3341726 RepID=UPI0035A963ED